MDYNYHTHTYLCGHAVGTPEEYVLKAIEGGIKYMGFSEHIPHLEKDGTDSPHRVKYDMTPKYIEEVFALKEKYKDKIEIIVGFETEYYPESFNEMVNYSVDFGAEYLILGQHYISEYDLNHVFNPTDSPEILEKYVSCTTEAIKTGNITYVAHPDIINFTGDIEIYKKEMRKICKASRENNIPIELSFLGIRSQRKYPNEIFWEIAGEEKSPVTFGFDAHDPDGACDKASLKRAEEMVKKFNLNYIGKPQIIRLKKV